MSLEWSGVELALVKHTSVQYVDLWTLILPTTILSCCLFAFENIFIPQYWMLFLVLKSINLPESNNMLFCSWKFPSIYIQWDVTSG